MAAATVGVPEIVPVPTVVPEIPESMDKPAGSGGLIEKWVATGFTVGVNPATA